MPDENDAEELPADENEKAKLLERIQKSGVQFWEEDSYEEGNILRVYLKKEKEAEEEEEDETTDLGNENCIFY